MEFAIQWRGTPAGRGTLESRLDGLHVEAVCRPVSDAVLRLYARAPDGRTLRLGVLIPEGGSLRLRRRLSPGETGGSLPDESWAFDLDDGTVCPSALQTGDPALDRLLRAGQASCTDEGTRWVIRCPFVPGQPCALAFALTACTIEDGQAVLRRAHPAPPP